MWWLLVCLCLSYIDTEDSCLQDTPTAAIAAQPTTAGYLTMARHALPSVPPPIDTVDSDRSSNSK
jgi:hypothetical protein